MTKRRAAKRSRWWDQTDGGDRGNFDTAQQTLTCWFSHFLTRKNTLIVSFLTHGCAVVASGWLFLNIRFSRVSFAPRIFNHIYHISETQNKLSDSSLRSQTPTTDCMFVTCGSEMCRTVCSLSLCCCLDSSSYTWSRSACGNARNLLMVHRFSHNVRFSGLGLSFHLSSSHSQPWRKKRG